jgi:GAF domain-containing protein
MPVARPAGSGAWSPDRPPGGRPRAYAYVNDVRLTDGACGILARRQRKIPATAFPLEVGGMDGQLLSATFVELTDTMVAGFDVIDFMHVLTNRSVELLGADAAGLLLADPGGTLRVVAASSEAARLLELFQLQSDQGPCLDCFRSGQPVAAANLAGTEQRWPRFSVAAQEAGFAAVQALPMRLRDQVIGALNLFRVTPGVFDPADVRVGQALADVATISLLHERSMNRSGTLNEQLQSALRSRAVIEQAKGRLAERLGIDMDAAFSLLRAHARNRNLRLADVARDIIDGTELLAGQGAARAQPLAARQVPPAPRPGSWHRP